jgi:triosephosphate isomerase
MLHIRKNLDVCGRISVVYWESKPVMTEKMPTRTRWVIGNWKMNPASLASAHALASTVVQHLNVATVRVGIAPSTLHLCAVQPVVAAQPLALVAQDVAIAQGTGAHTGDVSASLLADIGVSMVLVGHSERRMAHQESDACIAQKLAAALHAGLTAVLCVGEQLSEREAGQAEHVVLAQLQYQLDRVDPTQWQAQVLVAYEPVWAIGTGRTASPADAQAMHAAIRACLQAHDPAVAQTTVLYGGSVKPDNAALLAACPDVDGALVGGAALDAVSFLQIAQAFDQ